MDQFNLADHSSELDRELQYSESASEHSSSDFVDDTDEDPDFQLEDIFYDSEDFINPTPSPPKNIRLPVSIPSHESDSESDNVDSRPNAGNRRVLSSSDDDDDDIESDWEEVVESSPPNIEHHFDYQETPGPKHIPQNAIKPIDFFNLFFTTGLIELFVNETNRYAESFLRMKGDTLSPRSRFRSWLPVTVPEMRIFIATILNMGLVKKPTIKSYWSKTCSETPWFTRVFSRDRFENLLSFFHMVDTSKVAKPNEPNYDACARFQPIFDHCNRLFPFYYLCNQQVSIDESMIGTKNQTSLMQYMPNKHHHRWGIKLWALCDSVSKYCVKFFCYKGKASNEDKEQMKKYGLGPSIVMKLLEAANYLRKGYHVFIDNFFTSIQLANVLYSQETFVTGTIRRNRKGLPQSIKKKFSVGEKLYNKKRNLVALAYREKKTQKLPVLLVSTNTTITSEEITKRRRGRIINEIKPSIVASYNKFMGGIDAFDMMMCVYIDERRTIKYWKKVTFNLFSRMLLNAYILYTLKCKEIQIKPMPRFPFIENVIGDISKSWLDMRNGAGDNQVNGNRQNKELVKLSPNQQKTCWVCSEKGGHSQQSRKRKRASYICSICKEGCHPICFPKHTCAN
ncbi:zinc finger protein [Homalodisca vitripennis]|nr:zinc finger protein [Homalodisca vitripennis]